MKDFDELKSLWSNQVAHPQINADDVIKLIKKTRSLIASRLLRDGFVFTLASVAIITMWVVANYKMWTTHVAILVFLGCCLYFIILQLIDYRKINNETLINKPEDYINQLKEYKRNRHSLNTTTYRNFIFLLSFGFALYFIEIFFIFNLFTLLLGIISILSWFAYCYFVLMKRHIRKEENRLNEMITNLERLKQQFASEEELI